MKKLFFLFVAVLLLTGCTNINNLTLDEIVNVSLKDEVKPNTYNLGYKFYLPVSMSMSNDLNSNNVLYSSNCKYYLYVDIVSYHNKINNKYDVGENSTYYYKHISYNAKEGYVLINETLDGYLLEIMYNYAKIEVIGYESDINNIVTYAMVVLSSVTYNDNVIQKYLSSSVLTSNEESFDIFEIVGSDNYLEFTEEEISKDEIRDPDYIN